MQKEVAELKGRLGRLKNKADYLVADSVKASASQVPFQEKTVTITGLGGVHRRKAAQLEKKITARKDLLLDKLLEIEDFITDVNDSEVRTILGLRYIEGLPWRTVAQKAYGTLYESRPRMVIKRFFEKN